MSAASARDGRRAAAEAVGAAGSLLLVTHARPDGDGLGSILALALCAEAAGVPAAMLVPDNLPDRKSVV